MEAIIDFIFDNLWWLIMALIFLSGFSKSKKKKGKPVEQDFDNADKDVPWSEEDFDEDYDIFPEEAETSPPQPSSKSSRRVSSEANESPWRRIITALDEVSTETKNDAPDLPAGHYDAPYSGEGKVDPHGSIKPLNDKAKGYSGEGKVMPQSPILSANVTMPYDGEGKVFGNSVVTSTVTAAKDDLSSDSVETYNTLQRKLSAKKMTEAIVLSEILAKPKALRTGGKNL